MPWELSYQLWGFLGLQVGESVQAVSKLTTSYSHSLWHKPLATEVEGFQSAALRVQE